MASLIPPYRSGHSAVPCGASEKPQAGAGFRGADPAGAAGSSAGRDIRSPHDDDSDGAMAQAIARSTRARPLARPRTGRAQATALSDKGCDRGRKTQRNDSRTQAGDTGNSPFAEVHISQPASGFIAEA